MLTFIFDLDDTLIDTNIVFLEAERIFFSELEELGYDGNVARRIFEELDVKNVQRFGFMPKRFYTSLGETYQTMCELNHKEADQTTRERLEDIGHSVFRHKYRVLNGTMGVLEMLLGYGDRLLLWTRGDADVQIGKLSSSGLDRYFSRVYVLANKTTEVLLGIALENQLHLPSTWVVGDSIRSDINPALGAGAQAIWIPTNTAWRYEDEKPIRDGFITFKDISQLVTNYGKLRRKSQESASL